MLHLIRSFYFLVCFTGAVSSVHAQTVPGVVHDMKVNEAVMVTAELEYGSHVPTVEEAMKDIERLYFPENHSGRTFAILDAYGEAMNDGRLHISMHVSTELPGEGKIVFRKTGRVLWHGRIKAADIAVPHKEKKLTILIGTPDSVSYTVDGSGKPTGILQAKLKETGSHVYDFWQDGAEKELTFLYSTCGCPVKVLARRTGLKITRSSSSPVIFPDDPAVVSLISRLMGW